MPTAEYWSLPRSDLLLQLGATPQGLTDTEASDRLHAVGDNRLRPARRGAWADALVSQLRNPLLWLLLGAACIALVVHETTDAATVIAILLLGSLISIIQEGRAGSALEELRASIALRSRVLRDGQEKLIPTTDLVPGDVVVLVAGSLVPADAVLLEARDLFANEAPLTGEPFAIEKTTHISAPDAPLRQRNNVVHMGTSIRSGRGRALIVLTGKDTALGHIATELARRPPETDFQHGLRRFGYLLLSIIVVLVSVVFVASGLRGHPPLESLLFAVALAIGLAPEMLPAILATMLSRGARRMSKRGVLVRRLESIENLGNMTVLCTDKTGTLTRGDVQVEDSVDPSGTHDARVLQLAYWNAALQDGMPNPLDEAIVTAMGSERPPPPRKLDELPFDFARKRLSVLVEQEGRLLVTKGAFESILSACTMVRAQHDTTRPLDDPKRDELRAQVMSSFSAGARVIAVATRLMSNEVLTRDAERALTLEGFVILRDPVKAHISQTLGELHALGIGIKIISGDHPAVVRHVADQIGSLGDRVVSGTELSGLHESQWRMVVSRAHLFAEVDPDQKERILVILKKAGHVVGFMGDGINDAPAIRAADVGISVEGATDVAREAADFVLLAPDLRSLRDGVRVGRQTFANTLKYILTTESANLGNMVSMAAASLFLPFLPLLAHQVLLNNLLSDVPSAALATDHVDSELVQRPQRWDVRFIRRFMIIFGLTSTAFDAFLFVLLTTVYSVTPDAFRTAWFVESLVTELLVLFVLRTRRSVWRSRPHAALVTTTALVAGLTVVLLLSPVARPLGFVPLPANIWLTVAGLTLAYLAAVEIIKRRFVHDPEQSARIRVRGVHERNP